VAKSTLTGVKAGIGAFKSTLFIVVVALQQKSACQAEAQQTLCFLRSLVDEEPQPIINQ
jgi:hypothetical protein